MMKALKLKIYQEMACYKKPFALKVAETYPLPPYSTIKGFLHYILKAQNYIDMAISVQGDYEDKFVNLQTYYFFKGKEVTKAPLNVHYLHNVNLIIHIYANENILNNIYENVYSSKEFFSIGRREDIARIDEIKLVEFKQLDLFEEMSSFDLNYSAYIPKFYGYEGITGINYSLNYKYEIKNNLREWEKINVIYAEKESNSITNGKVYVDEEEDIIFFNKEIEGLS
ncbi:type I-B CRISPR-associated protein Cas5b [Caloramator mitchellensis]|nr:type I-B CRISPR-associated protein Cas5b [Caloramator mitchellensis]